MTARNQSPRPAGRQDGDRVLAVDSLDVEYETNDGPIEVLRDVSIDLFEGETLGIAGESGSGKSTLALSVLRYLGENGRVTGGSVSFKDESILEMSSRRLRSVRGNEIAHVAQDPRKALNPSLTVGEQIAETVRFHQDVSRTESRRRTHEILADTDISDPEIVFEAYPHELSGGMQQRVLIAMALSCNPDTLILDEPTTGLDVTTQAKILNLVDDLTEKFDTSVLLITHNLGIIAEIADRAAILYAGEIMERAPVEEIFETPANPYTQGLFATIPDVEARKELTPIDGQIPDLKRVPEGCVFADRCDLAEEACRTQSIELESVDSNHQTRCRRWEAAIERPVPSGDAEERPPASRGGSGSQSGDATGRGESKGKEIVEVSDLHKHYDVPSALDELLGSSPPVKAVDGVSLEVHEGESLALIGESGCGKSTLGRTVLGLTDPTAGTVSFRGTDVASMSRAERDEFRSECQIVFQSPDSSLNPRKDVYHILERPLKLFTEYGATERRDRVAELLSQVGLGPEYASRYPHELSGGEQQRVAIARAFAAEPSFVILDEPVSSLDVNVQANILNLLDSLREDYDTSYLFVSHDLSVVRHLCDRIAVMYLGEIVETGPIDSIFEDPKHPYTEALLESVPTLDPATRHEKLATLHGEVPSPRDPPAGCTFHTRCPYAREACTATDPAFVTADGNDVTHEVACLRELSGHDYWDDEPLEHTSESGETT